MTRRESRELAFVLIFEKTFTDESFEEIINNASESRDIEVDDYAKNTCVNVELNKNAIDEIISKYLHNWTIKRISRVALSSLRLALYEIVFESEIPYKVSINESVELAKKYAGVEDASFVNGVLGSYIRENVTNAEDVLKEIKTQKEIVADSANMEDDE